ncbi:pantoate kinase [Candidatus Methanocrinis natronophilus]|uniref:Pantoate kinase n=1 Tax=Candidatus Methanocrinis natronophilus TaxID=3033396 RepID=A0ABT5X8Z4_9EURY|nr:GHMP kinase [Candidatus Methanocrinis natronophilus]MDF0591168.1 GHMP kinase [Candidatus Methanocrinis natronophilus]
MESQAPVTKRVVESLAPSPVRVETELFMPQGSGFGASGAGALSSAYAINGAFDLALTASGVGEAAHRAEVASGTGLGDVIAQNAGGLVVRLSPGAPGVGSVDRIPVPPLRIGFIVRGPLSTEEVLSDPSVMRGVNREGERALKELLRRPTLERFVFLSWEFARLSGLAKDWMEDAVEAVEASGGSASMVMLGDAVFAVGGAEALAEFGDVISARVSLGGAGLE